MQSVLLIVGVITGFGCQTRTDSKHVRAETPFEEAETTQSSPQLPGTISELEALEAQFPNDPKIKLQIAQLHFCNGNKGLALESLLWIRQFQKEPTLINKTEEIIQKIRRNDKRAFLCR